MKTYLIPIKLKSIRKNPNAGSEQTIIQRTPTIRFSFNGLKLPECLKDNENCFITEKNMDIASKQVHIEGILKYPLHSDLLEQLWGVDIIISQENNSTIITHFPEPDYFYKYEIIEVKCNNCKQKFKSNEFQSLDNDNDDCFASTETGCPKCGEWDCCSVKYEKIEDALKIAEEEYDRLHK
jgi:hypothetical protein